MLKNATKCTETQGKWCKNKHGASKIMDTFETYQSPEMKIRSFLRCSLPSFYNTEVLLPLINLGNGLPQTAKERDSCCLQSLVDVVFAE
jgi:hypothetical protein